jgi:integrase
MASATFRPPPKEASRTKWPAGSWEAKWREPGKDGRLAWRNKKGFATRREALAYAKRIEGDVDRGDHIPAKLASTRFEDVARQWLDSKHFDKDRTRVGYDQLLRNHVLPTFGATPVSKITKLAAKEWVKDRVASGVGPGTIRNAYRNVLKPVMDHAVDSGYLRANPVIGVTVPRTVKQEMCFLTADEVSALARETGERYGLLVTFAAYTGLRAGELAALRVGRLDLMRKVVHVRESVTLQAPYTYGPTKTYAERTVTLPGFLIDPLMAYVASRASEPERFVFESSEGKPLVYGTFYSTHFRPAVERLVERRKKATEGEAVGLGPDKAGLRFHDLRHTCAALMINLSAANPLSVMKRMGHSSITVTYDRYGHLFPQNDDEIIAGLDAVGRAAQGSSAS